MTKKIHLLTFLVLTANMYTTEKEQSLQNPCVFGVLVGAKGLYNATELTVSAILCGTTTCYCCGYLPCNGCFRPLKHINNPTGLREGFIQGAHECMPSLTGSLMNILVAVAAPLSCAGSCCCSQQDVKEMQKTYCLPRLGWEIDDSKESNFLPVCAALLKRTLQQTTTKQPKAIELLKITGKSCG